MDRVLRASKLARLGILVPVALALLIAFPIRVFATTYNADMTGYAFFPLYGASGQPIIQTYFANHSPTYCPNDPAAVWSWGTRIDVSSPTIRLSNAQGQYYTVSTFYLYDNGDKRCLEGNYWVDIYFGRYTPTTSNCNCPTTVPGVCVYGVTNNCSDATSFGWHWSTYNE